MGLKINGSTSGSIEIDVPAVAGTDTSITIPATSGGQFIVSDSAGDVNIDSGTLFVDASTNRIGIGTTSPDYRMDVNGEVGITEGQPVTWHDGSGSAAAQIFATSGDDLVFRTNAAGNERMRIASGGNVTIGTTTLAAAGWAELVNGTTGNTAFNIGFGANPVGAGRGSSFSPTGSGANATICLRTDNGQIYATNTTITALSSERRLKENIVSVDPQEAWQNIRTIPYYSYNYIGQDATQVSFGPMADEVPANMQITTGMSDDVGVIRSYNNGMLQAHVYVALQTALSRIETLETANASLEARLTALEGGAS